MTPDEEIAHAYEALTILDSASDEIKLAAGEMLAEKLAWSNDDLDLDGGGYIAFNLHDTEVTVWCNSQGFSPPGPPISNYQVTVMFGMTELPGYADVPWTGNDEYDEAQCLSAARKMLDNFRAALLTAYIPEKVQKC